MNKFWKLALCVLAVYAVTTACSDDKDAPAPPQTANKDETRYLRISIVSNEDYSRSSRADDPAYEPTNDPELAAGVGAENTVKTLDFYFYDASKQYVDYVPASNVTDFKTDETPSEDNVEKIITSIVPVELTQGATVPSYVIVAVNAVDPASHVGKSMNEAQRDILKSIYRDNGNQPEFGMSNSVYYGYDNVSATENTLIMATPFDSNVLKTKKEMNQLIDDAAKTDASAEAKKALNDVTINCYVERYAAKITLQGAAATTGIDVEKYTSNGITLEFIPQGWALNNFEKSFYFVKSFRSSSITAEPDDFSTFKDVNTSLNGWKWNNPDYYRSYWTRTPAYYDESYPVVADDITDVIGGVNNYNPTVEVTNYPYNTWYESYENLTKEGGNSMKAIGSAGYYSESTVSQKVLTGEGMPIQHNVLAAIPSAIVVGYYKVTDNEKNEVKIGSDSPTFYTYGTITEGTGANETEKLKIYTAETSEGGAEIKGATSLLDYMLEHQRVVFYKDPTNSNPVYELTKNENVKKYFSIEHPAKDARTNLKIASSIVSLQRNSNFDREVTLYYHDPESGDHTDIVITSENADRVNRLLFESLGGAMVYNHGRAFFSAPIQHLGWQRSSNANKGLAQSEWDWSKMQAGDFGVVRNHVYTLSVNKISGLGTGILNYKTPILPPSEHVAYNMRFSIRIQKWAVVPTQSIDW